MDQKRPFAKAIVVKDGVFAYIGSPAEAKRLAGADAKVLDYGRTISTRASLSHIVTATWLAIEPLVRQT
ncbi:MAG: hypothetical protein IKO60_01260 [Bacteroidaceae bacterium]|nr:hypothetical protein [Bacteroidaceae bacterium]